MGVSEGRVSLKGLRARRVGAGALSAGSSRSEGRGSKCGLGEGLVMVRLRVGERRGWRRRGRG